MEEPIRSFLVEDACLLNYDYMCNMLDDKGQPYFHVFHESPPCAVHDWPDFGDVTSRQLQAMVMTRHMTGVKCPCEDTYRRKLYGLISDKDGLLYRPASSYSRKTADVGEHALVMQALITLAQDGDDRALTVLKKQINSLQRLAVREDGIAHYTQVPADGLDVDGNPTTALDGPAQGLHAWLCRPLVHAHRYFQVPGALELAGELIRGVHSVERWVRKDGTFRGHMHISLAYISGLVDYARETSDSQMLKLANDYYQYAKTFASDFGFIAEVAERPSDLISVETCTIMDLIYSATNLANNGYPEYWDDVERAVRNQLVENQIRDTSWALGGEPCEDTDTVTWRNVAQRMIGGFAGNASPIHYVAYADRFWPEWCQGENKDMLNRTRGFMNCCGGSGAKAFFLAWRNSVSYENGVLEVRLHLDHRLPEAEVRCMKPYKGLTKIRLLKDAAVRIRVMSWMNQRNSTLTVADKPCGYRVSGNFWVTDTLPSGTELCLKYPLPIREQEVVIGNPGRKQFRYQVKWKGDSVIRITPHEENPLDGYSEFVKGDIRFFGREEGPGRTYQRQNYMKDIQVPERPIKTDGGGIQV